MAANDEREQARAWVARITEEEEAQTILSHFSASDAFELGTQIRNDYLTEYYPTGEPSAGVSTSSKTALQAAHTGIVISIQSLEGQQLFATQAGHPLLTSADNWDWVARKFNTVRRYGRASFFVGRNRVAAGKPLDGGLDPLQYAAHGGAVPIRVQGDGIAPVAVAIVSGLKQEDDHRLVTEAIAKMQTRQRNEAKLAKTPGAPGAGQLRTEVPLPPVKKQLIVFDFDW